MKDAIQYHQPIHLPIYLFIHEQSADPLIIIYNLLLIISSESISIMYMLCSFMITIINELYINEIGKNQGFVFKEDRAAKLLRDMLSAVNYLHENGIVHRDLKLENFLFEDSSPSSPLILIDFGLSKHIYEGKNISVIIQQ